MAIHLQGASCNVWSATSTTLGRVGLVGFVAVGSAALNSITIQDGTAIRIVRNIQITANDTFFCSPPIAFSNLNTVVTGTPSYSVIFVPRP